MKRRASALLLILFVWGCLPSTSQSVSGDPSLQSALARFVTAFDNLDWDAFRLSFDDDATVFYPRTFPERAQGRSEYEHIFKIVFEQIRGNKLSAPYMDIQPRGLIIQSIGDTAIVTFHLDDRPGFVNRRTMIWHRTPTGWKIAHLHASEVPIPPGKP